MRRSLLWLGLAFLLGCAPRPSPEPADPAAASRSALTMGLEDEGDPAVVALVSRAARDALVCTGSLIADRVVLTAAHCVPGPLEPGAPELLELEVAFDADLTAPGARVALLAVAVHPGADESADFDLALLLLAEPGPVAPLLLLESADLSALPRAARIVGYGRTAPDIEDDLRRREGQSVVTEAVGEHLLLGADPSLPCGGDSGGPVFLDEGEGERLAAVISRGDPTCAELARATRVDLHLGGFLRPTLEAWTLGAVGPGEPCLYDAHCAAGACVEARDEPELRFCSPACGAEGECPAPLACLEGLCRHPLPSPGALGAACASHEDCHRGECLAERGLCATRCVAGDACPEGFACEHLGGIDFYCLPEASAPPSAGCSVARAHRESSRPRSEAGEEGALLALLLAALALAARRT